MSRPQLLCFKEILLTSLLIYALSLLSIALFVHWLSTRQWTQKTELLLENQTHILSLLDASYPLKAPLPYPGTDEPLRCDWDGTPEIECLGLLKGIPTRLRLNSKIMESMKKGLYATEPGVDAQGEILRVFRPVHFETDSSHIFIASSHPGFENSFSACLLWVFSFGTFPLIALLPFMFSQLKKTLANYARVEASLQQSSQSDFLTGLYNRRGFMACAVREIARAVRNKYSIAFLLIDIDYFKQINDTYGHLAGDHTLKIFATFIKDNFRTEDLLARYGGDEFIIVLPDAKLKDIEAIAERLRIRCEQTAIPIDSENLLHITISIGGAVIPAHCIHGDDKPEAQVELMAQLADKALYMAKSQGRNRIIIYNKIMIGDTVGQVELSAWGKVKQQF